jgi:hypothetical protein
MILYDNDKRGESLNLNYLFNCIKDLQNKEYFKNYIKIIECIKEFEEYIFEKDNLLLVIKKYRDNIFSHFDKRIINNSDYVANMGSLSIPDLTNLTINTFRRIILINQYLGLQINENENIKLQEIEILKQTNTAFKALSKTN